MVHGCGAPGWMRVLMLWLAGTAGVAWSGAARGGAPDARAAAAELVREGREQERSGTEERALRRYSDALTLDPSYGEAYLGLAELRVRRGDLREAERVYSVALAHVPALRAALAGRARVRRALGANEEATGDLEAYLADVDDVGALRELAAWYGEDGRHAAQLATWRRLLVAVGRGGDAAATREARTAVRALQILVGTADPVSAPPRTDEVRAAIATVARRGG